MHPRVAQPLAVVMAEENEEDAHAPCIVAGQNCNAYTRGIRVPLAKLEFLNDKRVAQWSIDPVTDTLTLTLTRPSPMRTLLRTQLADRHRRIELHIRELNEVGRPNAHAALATAHRVGWASEALEELQLATALVAHREESIAGLLQLDTVNIPASVVETDLAASSQVVKLLPHVVYSCLGPAEAPGATVGLRAGFDFLVWLPGGQGLPLFHTSPPPETNNSSKTTTTTSDGNKRAAADANDETKAEVEQHHNRTTDTDSTAPQNNAAAPMPTARPIANTIRFIAFSGTFASCWHVPVWQAPNDDDVVPSSSSSASAPGEADGVERDEAAAEKEEEKGTCDDGRDASFTSTPKCGHDGAVACPNATAPWLPRWRLEANVRELANHRRPRRQPNGSDASESSDASEEEQADRFFHGYRIITPPPLEPFIEPTFERLEPHAQTSALLGSPPPQDVVKSELAPEVRVARWFRASWYWRQSPFASRPSTVLPNQRQPWLSQNDSFHGPCSQHVVVGPDAVVMVWRNLAELRHVIGRDQTSERRRAIRTALASLPANLAINSSVVLCLLGSHTVVAQPAPVQLGHLHPQLHGFALQRDAQAVFVWSSADKVESLTVDVSDWKHVECRHHAAVAPLGCFSNHFAHTFRFTTFADKDNRLFAIGGVQLAGPHGPFTSADTLRMAVHPLEATRLPTLLQTRLSPIVFELPTQNHQLMAAGGYTLDPLLNAWVMSRTTELWDACTETWIAGPPMVRARAAPGQAVVLDNGLVVLVGGEAFTPNHTATAEQYDVVRKQWIMCPGAAPPTLPWIALPSYGPSERPDEEEEAAEEGASGGAVEEKHDEDEDEPEAEASSDNDDNE